MQFKKDEKQWYYTIAFLLVSDRCRYGRLVEDLEHQFLYGSEKYPKTIIDAYNLINNWKNYQLPGQGGNNGIQFTNFGEDEYEEYHNKDDDDDNKDSQVHVQNQGKEKKSIAKIKFDTTKIICCNCGSTGHFKSV